MTKVQADPQEIKDNGPDALALSESDKSKALNEGAKEAAKETGKDAYRALTDGNLPGADDGFKYHGYDEIQQYADLIDLGIDSFEDLIKDKDRRPPENKIYGLLALERNGQNRTPYVKVMMKHLGLKANELPGGGPSYTNDISNLSDL